MKRSLQLLAILCLFNLNVSAQTSDNNHLLWRISGKGLSRPSYLFGTMHLTDKRLFYFGDSLYRALEQTEGFAAELDVNALLTRYFEQMIGERKMTVLLKDKVDSLLLKENREALEAKFGKPVDQITMEDLKSQENLRNSKALKSGEMNTFMDAYLMSLADRQGKWIGGIEDPEDQMGLDSAFTTDTRVTSLLEEEKKGEDLEWMIQIYLSEKLQTIDRTNSLWKGARDIILIRRNVKMAHRIDSLGHIRSCLFAVGAAHLPGDSGVVNLLRQRGFTVTPVISSGTIDPAKYKFKEVEKKWVDVWTRDSLYNVRMPAAPQPLKGMEELPIDMLFYYDPVATIAYFTAYIPLVGTSPLIRDSAMVNLLRHYRRTAGSVQEKELTIMGKPGKELLMEFNGSPVRLQVSMRDNYMVMNMVSGIKQAALFSKSANRFFDSFRPDMIRSARLAQLQAKGWMNYDYPNDGFSIQAPVKLKRTVSAIEEGSNWRRVVFEAATTNNPSYYLIAVDAVAPGYYTEDDSSFVQQTEKWIQEGAGELISSRHGKIGDVSGQDIIFKPKNANPGYICRIFIADRGSKRYALYRTYDSTTQKGQEDVFFQSFRLHEPSFDKWKLVNTGAGFSTYLPSSQPAIDTAQTGAISYSFYDSAMAASFTVSAAAIPKHYWTKSPETYFASRIDKYYSDNDSLLEKTVVSNGQNPRADLLIRLASGKIYKKVRLLLNGDTLYTMYSFLPFEQVGLQGVKRFFEDFRPTYTGGVSSMFLNKPEGLLNSLQSPDSAAFERARRAIEDAPFTAEDIPLLQQALLKIYQDFDPTANYWGGTATMEIKARLIELDSAGHNIDFVRKHYAELKGDKAYLKFPLLALLSANKSTTSYALLKQLLKEPLPATEGYIYLNELEDSLSLAKTLLPEAFNTMENGSLMSQIANLAISLLDSNLIDLKAIRDQQQRLHRLAGRLFSMNKEKLEWYGYNYVPVIRLIARLNNKESNGLLHGLTKVPSADILNEVVQALLKNKEPLSVQEVMLLAESDEYRRSVYDSLQKTGKLKAFPAEYATQRWLAQSDLFSYLYDDEEKPVLSLIEEKTMEYEGTMQRFYLFKVGFSEDDAENAYLGVAGPYSSNAKDLSDGKAKFGVYWKEAYDPKNVNALFKALMEQIAAGAEEE